MRASLSLRTITVAGTFLLVTSAIVVLTESSFRRGVRSESEIR
jgi:hypothetical protein